MTPEPIAAQLATAVARQNSGDLSAAQALYWQILAAIPTHFDALHLLGVSKCQQGQQAEGSWFIARALEQRPDDPGAHYNLAMALAEQHRHDDALTHFDRALALRPDHAPSWFSRGDALQITGQLPDAIASYQRALALQPGLTGALSNLAMALLAAGRAAEALALFQQALERGADPVTVQVNIGRALQDLGRTADACNSYAAACAADPDAAQPRWLWAMATLPDVATGTAEVAASRPAFAAALAQLQAWYAADRTGKRDRLELAWPFFLAYQNRNNRALMETFGSLRANLLGQWWQGQALPAPAQTKSPRLRVGIVSAHLHSHSVWHAITRGWFAHLDPARFALHGFHLGRKSDAETAFARARAASFTWGERGLAGWVQAIQAVQPDVLIYPGLGMDNLSANLASLRLAPVQLTSWGHPETTGLPTMDGFLSAAAFEPAGAEAAYSERLIRLPGLGVAYVPQPVIPVPPDLAALGIDPARPILLCPGAPFKYAPEDDATLAAIAAQCSQAQLIFFHTKTNAPLSARLEQRLIASFAAHGLDFAAHATFIPHQSMPAFHGLMQRADLMLDTPGFSGFNTAMQAIGNGLPVLAYEGPFMRGRLASGVMRQLGLPELVASTPAEYVALAARLVANPEHRQRLRARVTEGAAGLYDDLAAVRGLEEAIKQFFL